MGDKEKQKSRQLERTLGLSAALSIGVGTMVGAGIFVFPGIAAGYAGPAAMISFALAGGIALIVAFSTSEMATAMPESGGAYYYTSRVFGPLAGFIVGIGQWAGLIFASSFYLVGFGEYSRDLLQRFGWELSDPVIMIAFGTALFLTGLNLLGSKGVGKLQNQVVIVLTSILALLFGYGVLSALGYGSEAARIPGTLITEGWLPVFTTSALIFTSYLGFVQISTVAGEIKNPDRNLPLAIIGSVLIVTILYIIAIFVSTSVFPAEKLAELGETAMIHVAESLVGKFGALAILTAGLLATLSSANASVLSSSRAVYALSNDRMLPEIISKVNTKFGTPHFALLVVGVPIAAFIMLGSIEILAEVASILHLIMYAMICYTLLVLKNRSPVWYNPEFKLRGGILLPLAGLVTCIGILFFMEKESLILSSAILGISLIGYYFLVPDDITISKPAPEFIRPEYRSPRILVPIKMPDPKPLPGPLTSAFKNLSLFILAYKEVPEQTSPEQSREEFEDEYGEELREWLEPLDKNNIDYQTDMAFTPDIAETLDQYIQEKNFNAMLTARPISSVNRLLVPIYSIEQVDDRLSTVLYELAESSDLPVSVIALTSSEEESEEEEEQPSIRQVVLSHLKKAGLTDDQIRYNDADVDHIAEAVTQLSEEDDVVILAESKESDRNSLIYTLHSEIENQLSCPILVILRDTDMKEENE